MRGKYKIGQHMDKTTRTILAKKILQRNSPLAKQAIETMGFEIVDNELKMINEPLW